MTIEILIAIIGSGALVSVLNLVSDIIKRKLGKRDLLEVGIMTLLFDRIKYLGEGHIKCGEVDFDDRRNLHKMHEVYHNLGGNGDFDILMSEIDKLPRKKTRR